MRKTKTSIPEWTISNFTENLLNTKRWVEEAEVGVGEQLVFGCTDGHQLVFNFFVVYIYSWSDDIDLKITDFKANTTKLDILDLGELSNALMESLI